MNVTEPWQMTRDQWDAERERLRPCVAQSNFTKASASQAVARMRRLEWLTFGVRSDERRRLSAAAAGELDMTSEEACELLDIINTPITYDDVIARAKRLGLIQEAA